MTFSHLHTILQIVPFHTGQQISLTCCEIPWSLPPGSSSFSLLEGVLCYWLSLAAGPLGTSPLAPQENIEQWGLSQVQQRDQSDLYVIATLVPWTWAWNALDHWNFKLFETLEQTPPFPGVWGGGKIC